MLCFIRIEIIFNCNDNDTTCITCAKTLGKRITKVTTETQIKSEELTKHLMEIFKNHKLIKIFQTENFEINRMDTFLKNFLKKGKNCNCIC